MDDRRHSSRGQPRLLVHRRIHELGWQAHRLPQRRCTFRSRVMPRWTIRRRGLHAAAVAGMPADSSWWESSFVRSRLAAADRQTRAGTEQNKR